MSRIKFRNIQRFPYYLLLLPLFFVFHGYVDYYDIVMPKDTFFLLAQYSSAAMILWGLSYFLFKCWQKAALFTFFLFCFQFFFGSLHDSAKSLLGNIFLVKYSFILPASLALIFLTFLLLKQSTRRHNRLSNFLSILLIILIVAELPALASKMNWFFKKDKFPLQNTFVTCDTCAKPDIYFIVADEYAGYEQLLTLLHFDNKDFQNELIKRGFHIVKKTRSNYNSTPFSVASIVNMDYLTGISGDDDEKKDIKLCYEKINRNHIAHFFSSAGYRVINYSIFNFADFRTKNLFRFFPTNDRLISAQTFLSRIQRDILFHFYLYFNIHSGIQKTQFDVLYNNNKNFENTWREASLTAQKPRFVYTHLMMPHSPYYFDMYGNLLPPEVYNVKGFGKEKEYVSYLQFSNKMFLQLIDRILEESKKPPIIIFMSDHGFRFYDRTYGTKFQFMNINAVYLPNCRYEGFYDGMSNVNQFRVLLNTAFGQKLPLLKDSTVYIK